MCECVRSPATGVSHAAECLSIFESLTGSQVENLVVSFTECRSELLVTTAFMSQPPLRIIAKLLNKLNWYNLYLITVALSGSSAISQKQSFSQGTDPVLIQVPTLTLVHHCHSRVR